MDYPHWCLRIGEGRLGEIDLELDGGIHDRLHDIAVPKDFVEREIVEDLD